MSEAKFLSKSAAQIKKDTSSAPFLGMDAGTVYHDPEGYRAPMSVDLRQKYWEKNKPVFDQWDEYTKNGWNPRETTRKIRKNLDTGDWNLPIFYHPEVSVIQPEQTPAANLIARQVVENTTIDVTAQTDQPEPEFGLENTSDTESSYPYADATHTDYQFDVEGYGLASRIEDKLILGAQTLRASESVVETAQLNGMRQLEEKQIYFGTNYDANGFEGFQDMGNEKEQLDTDGTDVDWETKTRELITKVVEEGGNMGDVAVFTDFGTYDEVRDDLTDYTRYTPGGDALDFGFKTLEFDSVPIYRSTLIDRKTDRSTGDPFMFAVDMGKHYMGMLQDATVKPLAKRAPQEEIATDAYGALVSKAKPQIQYFAEA